VNRPTLLGQLLGAHTLVVAGTCAFLVLATMGTSALLLRQAQDRTVEATVAEVVNGIVVEEREGHRGIVAGAEEYFDETQLAGFRFELLDRDGRVVAQRGDIAGWVPTKAVLPPDGKAQGDRFRTGELWCGPDHVLRVVTLDVLHLTAVRRAAAVMLGALPLAAAFGTLLGRRLFRRRLTTLTRLEAAVTGTAAEAGASIDVPAETREIATLQDAFNGLLARLGEALSRERRFTQEAAHELRTPLATLRARLEPLATSEPVAAQALHDVEALDRLVDALLLLARSESAPLPATPVNLCDLARDAAQRRSLADPGGARPPEVDAPDEVLVRGSEDLLARALGNLVDNARKFGGPGARIVIRVREEGPRAIVSVADDGPGIPAGSKDHVFERFFRGAETRGTTEGAGLGLAVVRAIARRHQGSIDARSSELGGAELRLDLPALR